MGNVLKAIANIFGGGETSITLPTVDTTEATPSVRKETQASTVLGSDSVAEYLKRKKLASKTATPQGGTALGGLSIDTKNML